MKLVDVEGHPLGRRYYCPKDDKVLSNDDLVRGYETASGKMVVVTDEEFESAAPEKSRDIELKRFVALDEIPPAFFDHPYFLAPDERAGKAYALLAQTMAKSGKAGIGSFVMHGHEYLVAILADNGMLRAEVLHYASEIRTPQTIGLPKAKKPDAGLVRSLSKEIDSLTERGLKPSEMEDVEAAELRALAQRKAKAGKGVIAAADLEDPDSGDAGGGAEVVDLMQILRKSLGAQGGSSGPTASARTAPRATPAKKSSARKTPAKKAAPRQTAARKTGGGAARKR
jgi:DNA end-binding protein Ku